MLRVRSPSLSPFFLPFFRLCGGIGGNASGDLTWSRRRMKSPPAPPRILWCGKFPSPVRVPLPQFQLQAAEQHERQFRQFTLRARVRRSDVAILLEDDLQQISPLRILHLDVSAAPGDPGQPEKVRSCGTIHQGGVVLRQSGAEGIVPFVFLFHLFDPPVQIIFRQAFPFRYRQRPAPHPWSMFYRYTLDQRPILSFGTKKKDALDRQNRAFVQKRSFSTAMASASPKGVKMGISPSGSFEKAANGAMLSCVPFE